MCKISVIVPIYNSELLLERCVDSISNQTYKNIEILLVNDGSTDGSLEKCHKLAQQDKRIKVYNKINGGVSSARRLGLAKSTGDYISFVDSDDYISSTMYEKMINIFKKYSADIVECGFYYVNDNGVTKTSNLSFDILDGKEKNIISSIKAINTHNQLWNKLYKESLFDVRDIKDFHYSEDYFTNVQLASKVSRKIIIEDKLYYYYDNMDGAMNAEFSYKKLDRLKVREIIFNNHHHDKNLKLYMTLNILKTIISLYVELHKSSNNEAYEYKKTLINRFNKYFDILPSKMIKKVKPFKYRISIILFKKSPGLFESVLDMYFLKSRFVKS